MQLIAEIDSNGKEKAFMKGCLRWTILSSCDNRLGNGYPRFGNTPCEVFKEGYKIRKVFG